MESEMKKMGNLDIYEKYRVVPAEAMRPIQAGRMKGKTDINPMWRIKALTEQFGPCGVGWYYVPVKKWTEQCGEEVAAFVDIELYIRVDGEWSRPIPGTGGNMFAAKERNGIYVSDECYKMATTDAISVACKQLGIGADVYWQADQTKYDPKGSAESVESNPDKALVQAVHINTLCLEMKRTGVGMKNLLGSYHVDDIHKLTMAQFAEAMAKFKQRPDKPTAPDPGTIPDSAEDPELPWNEPKR